MGGCFCARSSSACEWRSCNGSCCAAYVGIRNGRKLIHENPLNNIEGVIVDH